MPAATALGDGGATARFLIDATIAIWLNVGLSLIAGYAAIALGHWIGAHWKAATV